tara:strand:+ start:42 stop:542 length:501 start_codon:yes stop_codon:yes gene_type:complete
MTDRIGDRTFDVPKYKVTGYAYDGRICLNTGDKWLVRMPPRYFSPQNNHDEKNKGDLYRARKYYDERMVAAILWQSVDSLKEGEYKYRTQKWKPKGSYTIINQKGLKWGLGVRASNPKGNNQHTPKEQLARTDPNNFRHGNKYPSSNYNQWLKDGAKKEREKKDNV